VQAAEYRQNKTQNIQLCRVTLGKNIYKMFAKLVT
jgi:hypothetical protein